MSSKKLSFDVFNFNYCYKAALLIIISVQEIVFIIKLLICIYIF